MSDDLNSMAKPIDITIEAWWATPEAKAFSSQQPKAARRAYNHWSATQIREAQKTAWDVRAPEFALLLKDLEDQDATRSAKP